MTSISPESLCNIILSVTFVGKSLILHVHIVHTQQHYLTSEYSRKPEVYPGDTQCLLVLMGDIRRAYCSTKKREKLISLIIDVTNGTLAKLHLRSIFSWLAKK